MLGDVVIVMRGTLIAQALAFLALPLLTRLFDPSAFGHYQLFISVLTLLLVFTTLRYEVALLRARDGRALRATVQLCLLLTVSTSIVCTLALSLLSWLGWPEQIGKLPFPVWMLAAAMLFGGLTQFLTILVTREKAFRTSARGKILQSASYVGASVGIGATAPIFNGLIVADLFSRLCNAAYLVRWSTRRQTRLWRPAGRAAITAVARRYREYPFISVPGTAINVLGGVLTPVMIYASFSAAASGQYGLLERSVTVPLGLVIVSVGQVFTAQFSAELRKDPGAATAYFAGLLRYMALLAIGVALVLVLAGPWLFVLVFGEEWRLAGELSRLMAPAFGSMLLSGPMHMVLTVMGHQKLQTAWEISRLALVAGLWAAAGSYGFALETAVAIYSAIVIACNVAFVALGFVMLRRATRARSRIEPVEAL